MEFEISSAKWTRGRYSDSAAAFKRNGPVTATSSGTALSDSDRQTIMMEIQNIRQKQQEMFGLVSNILKAGHDTRLSIINNIR